MKKELFAELIESIKQGGKILKGRAKPKRAFKYDELDVKKIRPSRARTRLDDQVA